MAFDPGAIDATLAAAVGDDPVLIAELRVAFVDAAGQCLSTLKAAENEGAWVIAALRLKGLAASFGAVRLIALADEAAGGPIMDQGILRRLHRAIDRL